MCRKEIDKKIKDIYSHILNELEEIEKDNSEYIRCVNNGYIPLGRINSLKDTSLLLKIKENRKEEVKKIIKRYCSNCKIINEDQYYTKIEIKEKLNYILIKYVVNSHVTTPKSLLNRFAHKTEDGQKIYYIDIDEMIIKEEKTRDYGAEYGYYSKELEEVLNREFEGKFQLITKAISEFGKGKVKNLDITHEMQETIYDFFDISTYRNKKMVEEVNKNSATSILVGGYDHEFIVRLALSKRFPHIYKDLKINFIINKTERDFVLSNNILSSVIVDDGNEILIMPVNPKICIALMQEEYYKKYLVDGNLYYMNIENEEKVKNINGYIFAQAKRKHEDVIGNEKELEELLLKKDNLNDKGGV